MKTGILTFEWWRDPIFGAQLLGHNPIPFYLYMTRSYSFGVFADLRQIYPVWVETIYMRSKQQTGHTKERRKCKFYFLVKEKIVLYYFQFKPRKVFKVFIHFPGSVSAKNSRLIKVAKRSFKLSSRQLEKCGWFISYQFRSRWLLPLPPSISALSHFRLIPNYIYNSTIFQFRETESRKAESSERNDFHWQRTGTRQN